MLARVRGHRGLNETQLTIDHVRLAHESWELEREIGRVTYKAALERVARLLQNDLLASEACGRGVSGGVTIAQG